MKINIIGMILSAAGSAPFEGLVSRDDGAPMDATDSLDFLIMEYAKARQGDDSQVALPARYRTLAA